MRKGGNQLEPSHVQRSLGRFRVPFLEVACPMYPTGKPSSRIDIVSAGITLINRLRGFYIGDPGEAATSPGLASTYREVPTMTFYTPEERKARLEAAHADLTAAVEAISTSEHWVAFLDFARKLHNYSAQNRMWLFQQAMLRGWHDLGHIAGYRTWLTLRRYVRKGERGLQVLVPVRVKTTDDDGSERWAVRGFKVEHVFAARQTEGDGEVPEPIRPVLLIGDGPRGGWDSLAGLVAARGFELKRGGLCPENGVTSFTTRTVVVADRLDDAAAVKTLAHELAHVMLHALESIDYHANRARCEVEAESVAFLVCHELGLATDLYTFPYVASWASGSTALVVETAGRVLTTAAAIVAELTSTDALPKEVAA